MTKIELDFTGVETAHAVDEALDALHATASQTLARYQSVVGREERRLAALVRLADVWENGACSEDALDWVRWEAKSLGSTALCEALEAVWKERQEE